MEELDPERVNSPQTNNSNLDFCFLPVLTGVFWPPLVEIAVCLMYSQPWSKFKMHGQNLIFVLPYLLLTVFLMFSQKKYSRREIFIIASTGTLATAAPVFTVYLSTRLYHLSKSGGYTGDALTLALAWVISFVTLFIGTALAILFVRYAKRPGTKE